jgi:hypothetical protein
LPSKFFYKIQKLIYVVNNLTNSGYLTIPYEYGSASFINYSVNSSVNLSPLILIYVFIYDFYLILKIPTLNQIF